MKNQLVERALEVANKLAYSDYRINAGVERKAVAKLWEKDGKSRTYITIQCFTLAGRSKGSYDCGYIDNNTEEYVVTDKTEISLLDFLTETETVETSETVEVELIAFTGMVIGTFTAKLVEDAPRHEVWEIVTKKGVALGFDKNTLVQTNANNPKYANKIRIKR